MTRKTNLSYNEIRSLDEDWALDERNGLRYSGESVQKAIKDNLRKRAGVFHYDTGNNRYLVFSDEASRDKYFEDPQGQSDLLLGAFDAPFEYSASIQVENSYISALSGTTGLYLDYQFDIVNKQGASVGDDVNVVYTFNNGGVKRTVRASYAAGTEVHFLLDSYLKTGQNTVTIAVTGQNTLAATTQMVTVFIVDLSLTSTFDFSKAVAPNDTLNVPFVVSGGGIKTVTVYIDGTVATSVAGISDATASRTAYVRLQDIASIGSGLHTLQLVASVESGGTTFNSTTLYYNFVVTGGDESYLLFFSELGIGETQQGTTLEAHGTQYEDMTVKWAYYTPADRNTTITFTSPEGEEKPYIAAKGQVYEWTYSPTQSGKMTVNVTDGTKDYQLYLDIAESTLGIKETTDELVLRLSASGRSNSEKKKDQWVYDGQNRATFTGFDWNGQSGWVRGGLLVRKGTGVDINVAPFSGLTTSVLRNHGVTVEIDYSTDNVDDEEAPVITCANDCGVGINITATEASITSQLGASVSTKFKPRDRQRIAFNMHRTGNTTEDYGLMTIVTNSYLERAVNINENDSLNIPNAIHIGSEKADVTVYNVTVYATDLTVEQNFGNYAVNAPNSRQVANENDVLDENGNISYEKVRNIVPTFIFTGPMSVILNAMSKKDNARFNVSYHNPQAPEYDFSVIQAYVCPQGTSSLNYPIKNLRLYTSKSKEANCVMRDASGNVLDDGLYSFKEGAQPVNCWTLKADYAESSMSHNTGTARLWNDLMKNVQVGGRYVCRTRAQQAAIDNGYEYDVRTAIDGFPCCVFYRTDENSSIIFMGQFNFNNDKSTESVFGFRDVPGTEDFAADIECWEALSNTSDICLFKESDFYTAVKVDGTDRPKWSTAFESRYPDTKTPNTSHLKAFADWLVSVNGDADRFKTEKWEHIDVYKMAGYYLYLIRHGAVDQTVKNSMLTTEGHEAWRPDTTAGATAPVKYTSTNKLYFYTFYDNDTNHGINNDSRLAFSPYITRKSADPLNPSGYAYAGYDSVLWNMLEADTEFMNIVQQIDQQLYQVGYSYEKCIEAYDTKQSSMWPARIYNASQRYKYIQQYRAGRNLLYMLQGARTSHRHWWLKTRFDLFDSRFVSGMYRNTSIVFKVEREEGFLGNFTITSGDPLYYGYGINNVVEGVTDTELAVGESHTFNVRNLAVGDPVSVFGASHIQALDLSTYAHLLSSLQIASANSKESGSRLKKLFVGKSNETNLLLTSLTLASVNNGTTEGVTTIEELDIQGFQNITNVDGLSLQPSLHVFNAANSGLTVFEPAEGAALTSVTLPDTVQSIVLHSTKVSTLNYTPNSTLMSVTLDNVTGINSLSFVQTWVNAATSYENRSLYITGVNWSSVSAEWLCELAEKGWESFTLRGRTTLSGGIDEEMMERLTRNFGANCFSESAAFYIEITPGVSIIAPDNVIEGDTVQLKARVFPTPEAEGTYSWIIASGSRTGTTLSVDGLLTTTENGNADAALLVRVTYTPAGGGSVMRATKTINVVKATYPSVLNLTLEETVNSEKRRTYKIVSSTAFTGRITYEWTLTGSAADYSTLTPSSDGTQAMLVMGNISGTPYVQGTVSCVIKRKSGTSIATKTTAFVIKDESIAITKVDNAPVMSIMYANGLSASSEYMTKDECAAVTENQLNPGTSNTTSIFNSKTNVTSFTEFQYFTGLKKIPRYLFYSCYNLKEVVLPYGPEVISFEAFYNCKELTAIDIPEGYLVIEENAFRGCI